MAKYNPDSYWYYVPNKPAPIVFCVLFFLSGLVHAYQTKRYKSWRFTVLMPWSALVMVAGFALREVGAYHYDDLGILIASQVLVMSGPPVYAVTDYLVLSRILFYIPYLTPIHPGRVLTTFLGLDGIIEILIGQGVWRVVNSTLNPHQRQIGEGLIKAALILQAGCFIAFASIGVHFHLKARRAGVLSKNIRSALYVLYASAAIITVRCIYRIAEYFEGYYGNMYHTEVYFYIFEAAFMFLNTLILNIWHPGKYLPPNNHVFLAKDGKTEMRGPGWKDDRPFIVTVFDPFDLFGLFTGKDKKTRFWDMPPDELEKYCEEEEAKRQQLWYKKLARRFKSKKAPVQSEERMPASTTRKGPEGVISHAV